MANQWALLIGINQYTALQPLMYAQADAVALRNFFVDELGIPVNHCMLLTDMSAAVEPYAHYPLRREIESQLQLLCREKVEPGDLLWIFFSGYGLSDAGQDYWLPIDAEPMKLAETAIAVSTIFDILKTAKTDQILLTLDVNRSQGAVGHQNIGQQTLALANDFGIATVLSCQPEQYAHETMAIRHGLFTKALLEGLRYHGCVTASQLAAYLSDRVPELSQHHWRPIQNPVTAIPTDRKFMMVVPPDGIARLPITESAAADFRTAGFASASTAGLAGAGFAASESAESEFTGSDFAGAEFAANDAATATESVAADQAMVPEPSTKLPVPSNEQLDLETVAATDARLEESPQSMALVPVSKTKDEEAESTTQGFWKWLALAAALSVLVGAFLRYRPIQFARVDRADGSTPAETTDSTEPSPTEETTPTSDETQSDGPEAIPNTTEAPEEPDTPAAAADSAANEPLFSDNIDSTETGESALQRAEAAIAEGRYGQARAWLNKVPPEQRNEAYDDLVRQADSEEANAAVRNQQILNDARGIIQPSSASLFNDAIEQVRQVPTDDPYYEQAQADIARWSQVILDLAEGRANNGDIQGALAAAQLVPEDQSAVYQLAQQRVSGWQQQIENQQLIQQMQDSLQPGQASSFQNAIIALQQITPDQSGYSTAQERINQWSQDILVIARFRADQGDFAAAIAAAELVPENTGAYAQAIDEIQRWQEQI